MAGYFSVRLREESGGRELGGAEVDGAADARSEPESVRGRVPRQKACPLPASQAFASQGEARGAIGLAFSCPRLSSVRPWVGTRRARERA